MQIIETLLVHINRQMKKVHAEKDPAKLAKAITRGERLCALHDRLAKKNGGRLSTWT